MRRFLPLLALSSLLEGTAVLAQTGPRSQVKPFQTSESQDQKATKPGPRGQVKAYLPTELTEEEREAARVRARYKMGTWRESEAPPPEFAFPWMPLGFTLLIFALAAPFAWSAYRRDAKEMPDTKAFGASRRRPKEPTR